MPPDEYAITFVPNVRQNERRKIVFLESNTDADIVARKVFDDLVPNVKRTLQGRFDHWLDGLHHKKYHHGWDNEPNRSLYVIKWNDKQKCHRFYGFICHPKPKTNPRLELCVLAMHVIKTTWETDPTDLNGVRRLIKVPTVIQAIVKLFPEYREEGKK
ncbi:MAG: hypothetical protein A3F68_10270 [Acidobacteria bacterium RIFCSPLOWO2_12_FULL_54_10]|nr:MAG: hypothetical protein A3F68_10270 [Acidobacteria bacterium RIFCSPLOWO2_12_FULL_54_10]